MSASILSILSADKGILAMLLQSTSQQGLQVELNLNPLSSNLHLRIAYDRCHAVTPHLGGCLDGLSERRQTGQAPGSAQQGSRLPGCHSG